MIDTLTALFCGAMIPLLPSLLFSIIRHTEDKRMVAAWGALALLAWGVSIVLAFLSPLALVGIALGAALSWIIRDRPDFRVDG